MHLAVRTIDFDYPLPEELIADRPLPDRSASRMMVIHRDTGMIEHRHFCDLPEYVREGDHFILNDTRVVPARYFSNDGSIEIVRAEVLNPLLWKCMVRPGRKMKLGRTVAVGEAVGTVEGIDEEGYRLIRFDREVDEEKYGRLALPHYMNRESDPSDRERYQTVYARHEGAIAAPTAGLHFTPELLASVPHDFLTLHVGVGTFRPVKADRIEDHQMHTEHFFLPEAAARAVNNARRVIAVGTTSVRSLESAWDPSADDGAGAITARDRDATSLYLLPGSTFHVVDALVTNFHVPRSTLMMLVSAFSTRENIMNAYQHAIEERYRMLSFGDAMFIR